MQMVDESDLPPTEYQVSKLKELMLSSEFTEAEATATDEWLQKQTTRRGDVSRAIAKALGRLRDREDRKQRSAQRRQAWREDKPPHPHNYEE